MAIETSSVNAIQSEAVRVITMLKRDFLLPDGALCLERENNVQRPFNIFSDLGDTLPFLDYFGERDFVDQQVSLYRNSLRNEYLVSDFPTMGLKNLVKSYEYTDLILGLLWYAESRPNDDTAEQILMQAVRVARRTFRIDGRLKSIYHFASGVRLPVLDTRDAMFIESWVVLWRRTRDPKYLKEAANVFKTLLTTSFFRRYGLFADYVGVGLLGKLLLGGSPKCRQSSICKNTSSALFAFVELYRVWPEPEVLAAIQKLLSGLRSNAIVGGVLERFYAEGKEKARVSLTASFSILDALCDASYFVPELSGECVSLARGIADFWIERQGNTGLFPLYAGGNESFVDSETDMSIALYKLAEITGESHYREAADRCIDGLIRFHGAAGYCLAVDVHSGQVINAGQRTKFICLFLKVLILKIETIKGGTLYGDQHLHELLKDR